MLSNGQVGIEKQLGAGGISTAGAHTVHTSWALIYSLASPVRSKFVLAHGLSPFLTFYENMYFIIKAVCDGGCHWLSTQIHLDHFLEFLCPPFGFYFTTRCL